MTITTGNHPKLLWPGLKELFGRSYKEKESVWSKVFRTVSSDKSYEEFQELTGMGLAAVKAEGASIAYDTMSQGPTTRLTNVVYGLGFVETQESVEDDLYKDRAPAKTRALARSMRITKETVHANVINRAFTSAYAGGDGKELVATDHTSLAGSQSNELATPADLSEASIEDMLIQVMNATDSRGLRIQLMGEGLLVPNNLIFEAERILKSTLQPNSSENNINAMRSKGLLPKGAMAWSYLTDTDAWFVMTDLDDLISLDRRALSFDKDSDFDTSNFKHKATERYAAGWKDWRSIYGSLGA